MRTNLKIYKKLYGEGQFADQIAYGLFSAKEAKFIEKQIKEKGDVSDAEMDTFYSAEEQHLEEYKENAKREIQDLVQGTTNENATKLLGEIAIKVNGKHPGWRTIGLNVASAVLWDVVVIGVGLLAAFKFDVVFQCLKSIGLYIQSCR